MADSIIFKRLFEVQIVHDYYLTTANGRSFFDRNETEKRTEISKRLVNRIYDVREQFDIDFTGDTQKQFSRNKLVWAKTALGFIVGTEVIVQNQLGETVYKPRNELSNELNLTFSIRPKIPFFKGITNMTLRPSIPSNFYFTNKDNIEFNETTAPPYKSIPLSKNVAPHQNGKKYEMGELIDFGGTIKEAIIHTDGSNPADWETIVDRRFVNNSDRVLVPNQFVYRVKREQNVTQIDFVLVDQSNAEIKTINVTSVEALENVSVDFKKDNGSNDIPIGFYTLKIKQNAGAEVSYPIYINTEIYDKNDFGVIDIRFDELNSPYSLLDANGFLKTKITPLNQKILHPVFEIRFKNRRTYWRYNKEGDFSLDEINGTATHLQHSAEKLVSLKPKGLTLALVPFQDGGSQLIPYPRTPSIKLEEEKIFSEIYINPSNRIIN